nr:undecaprenyl-diphosphate phosphatase [Maliibacterium massiliense]
MNMLQAAILGLVQGLAEFLPISSSGHLVLVQKLMGIQATQDLMFFNIMLHVGTLFAVVAVFYRDIWEMIKHPFSKLPMLLVLATVPTVVIALLTRNLIDEAFEGQFLGVCFIITAIILYWVECVRHRHPRSIEKMGPFDALVIGTAQGLAILPGISRSGATIAAGLSQGVQRAAVGKFSMLMSMIAIVGAAVLEAPDALAGGMGGLSWGSMLIGIVTAALSGYVAIRWLLRILQQGSLKPFAIYLVILGLVVLGDQYLWHGVLG